MTSSKNGVFLYFTWYLTILVYHMYLRLVYYLHVTYNILSSVTTNEKASLAKFQETVPLLTKIPGHVAVAFQYNGVVTTNTVLGNNNEAVDTVSGDILNLKKVAAVASWISMAPSVSVISLYDYYGILKLRQDELKRLVQQKISELRNLAANKAVDDDALPKVAIHVMENPKRNDIETIDDQHTIHIFLYSRDDGKPAIINAVRSIYLDRKKDTKDGKSIASQKQSVDVATVSSKLNFLGDVSKSFEKQSVQTEPDLLISLGEIRSTLDFLPWHLKLTELHWLPSVNHLQTNEILGSFIKYAKCEQRFGK